MPEHPPYRKVQSPRDDEDPQGDFMWDVHDEPSDDEPSVSSLRSPSASQDARSELLRRFPRPGVTSSRHEEPRRTSSLGLVLGLGAVAASALAAAWMVAGS